jgi:hypothetical protein
VEASFFLDVLDTFSSRKKYQIFFATGKNKFSCAWWYPPSIHDFFPLIAAGALPFSVGKKYQCRVGTTRP